MNFASDNAYGVHPAVLQALSDCNDGAVASYGADPVTARAEAAIRDLLDAPEAAVRFVATGTAANALVCAQLSPSYGRIYCHDTAHIHRDECAAPEFFSHGAKLVPLPGTDGKIAPDTLAEAIRIGAAGSLNDGRNALVSITNATEWGTCYAPAEVAALARVAHDAGLPLHMDGARFANAVAGLGCAPRDLVAASTASCPMMGWPSSTRPTEILSMFTPTGNCGRENSRASAWGASSLPAPPGRRGRMMRSAASSSIWMRRCNRAERLHCMAPFSSVIQMPSSSAMVMRVKVARELSAP